MKISCPACAAKYSIADEKVQDRLAKIRCRKCGTTIVIDGKVSPPAVTASGSSEAGSEPTAPAPTEVGLGAVGPAAGEYSVDLGDHDQRSMSVAQLRAAFAQGSVTGDTFVWADGMADWQRIADVPDLFNQLSPTGASAAIAADPFTTPRASISTKERSSAADLFGGIESAGSEEDVTTSAPEPAPLAPQQPQAAAATGARNESSVLFSLSALTGGAPAAGSAKAAPMATPSAPLAPAAPRRAATQQSRDDSGLIDLKALSTAVNAPGGNDPFGGGGVSPLGLGPPALAPLGMPMGGSPLGGGVNAVPAADDLDMRRSGGGGKGMMLIAAALLIGGLAIAGVMAMKSGDDSAGANVVPPAAPVAETPRAPSTPTPEATPKKEEPVKAEEPTAAPPPTGTAAPAAAPAAKSPTSSASRPATTKRPTTSAPKAPEPAAAPAPAPKPVAAEPAAPKKPKCNCKPSDLLCAMKCSSKR